MKKPVIIIGIVLLSAVLIAIAVSMGNSQTENNNISLDNNPENVKEEVYIPVSDIKKPQMLPEPSSECVKKLANMIDSGKQVMPPDYGMMSNCTEGDYPYIRALLTHEEHNAYYGYAIRALGFIGTDLAVDDLLSMLREEGSPYTKRSTAISGSVLHAIGFAAHSNNKAYEFLKKGCKEETWRGRLKNWTIPEGSNYETELRALLSFSTQAVGMSGRNDARKYLYSLIPNVKDKDFIVSAVYKLDLIDEYGWEKWKHEIYPPPFRLYLQWSEKHPEWGKWRKGGPLPPLEESAGEE